MTDWQFKFLGAGAFFHSVGEEGLWIESTNGIQINGDPDFLGNTAVWVRDADLKKLKKAINKRLKEIEGR